MWGYREKIAVYEPGGRSSPNTESAGAFTLDFPGERIVRNKFLLLEATQSKIFFVTAAWTK